MGKMISWEGLGMEDLVKVCLESGSKLSEGDGQG